MDKIFNTYSFMTVKRILEVYGFNLDERDFYLWTQTKNTFLHKILYTPLALVMISVIYEQAKDFQVICTKIILEYLTSDAAAKGEDSPGFSIRVELEELRKNLVDSGEKLHQMEVRYKRLISQVQKSLITVSKSMQGDIKKTSLSLSKKTGIYSSQEIQKYIETTIALLSLTDNENSDTLEAINSSLSQPIDVSNKTELFETVNNLVRKFDKQDDFLGSFKEQTKQCYNAAKEFRKIFIDYLKQTYQLLVSLPDYFFDAEMISGKLQELDFDNNIGVDLV